MLNVNPHWRVVSRGDYTPFAAGNHGRALRIVVDESSIASSFELAMIQSFAGRPTVEIVGTSRTAERRVEVHPLHEHGYFPVDFILPDGGGFHGGVREGAGWRDVSDQAHREDGIEADEAFRALVLAHFCSQYEVDALVTETPFLQLPKWKNLANNSHAQGAKGAAALLGLHLRAHRDFTVKCTDRESIFLKEEDYYRGAAVAALASYPALFDAAQGLWRSTGDARPVSLLRGMETRLGKALRARDYFHVRVRSFSPVETWDDAQFFFEFSLLLLAGALDAGARFCHRVFGVEGKEKWASWGNKGWRGSLRHAVPRLKDLSEGRTDRSPVPIANAIGVLRNFIHAEALSHEFYFDGSDDEDPLIMDFNLGALALPPDEGKRFRQFINVLGDEDEWGIQEGYREVVLLLPALFLERALRRTVEALAELISEVSPLLIAHREDHFDPSFFIPGYVNTEELLALTGLEAR
jgi:hypothetical protein